MYTIQVLMKNIYFFISFLSILSWPNFSGITTAQNSWRFADDAPTATRFDDIYFTNDSTAFIGQDGEIYKSIDRGETWQEIGELPHNAYIRSIEFIDDNVGFIGTIFDDVGGKGFYTTTNGGISWTRIDNKVTGGMFGICGLDHIGSTIIGVGIYSEPAKFYISKDAGASWVSKTVTEAAALVDCHMINDSTYLVAGSSNPERRANILKTTDWGATWTQVAHSGAPTSYCWKLSLDNNLFGLASIEFSNTAFVTQDQGNSWEEIFINENAGALNFGGTAFLNNNIGWVADQWNPGIYETIDGGNNWNYLDFGSAINRIKILDNNTAIAVGKTVYIYDPIRLGTSAPKEETVFHSMTINPNPAKDVLNISLNIFQHTAVRLDLMDQNGALIRELFGSSLDKGFWSKQYNIDNLKPGNYFVWLRTNEGHMVKKIAIIGND